MPIAIPGGAARAAPRLPSDRPTVMPSRRSRESRHPSGYLYVREVKGGKSQARVWIGTPGGGHSVNLGLYDTARLAHQAVSRVLRRLSGPPTPLSVWAAMKPLIDAGQLPKRLLPKYAVRRPDGLYEGRVIKRGRRYAVGPFADPAEATAAVLGVIDLLRQSNTPRGARRSSAA